MNDSQFSTDGLIDLARLLDLTDLSDNCSERALDKLCLRARRSFGPVATVCVWPQFVQVAKEYLAETSIGVTTVVNFPYGDRNIDDVILDTQQSLVDHADEIDLVMPYRAFLTGDHECARQMIEAVVDVTQGKALLKVILETGVYPDQHSVAQASQLAIDCGADFLKTSTGKAAISATPEAARTMLEVIKASGGMVGFKAAGGISTLTQAKLYLDLVTATLGAAWIKPENFRFGTSSLLEAIEAKELSLTTNGN